MTVTVRGGVGSNSNNTSATNNSDPDIVQSSMPVDSTITDQSNFTPLGSSSATITSVNVASTSLGVPTTASTHSTSSPVNSLIGNDPVSSSSSLSEANTIIDGQDVDAIEEGGNSISGDPLGSDDSDMKFPVAELNRLDDMINRPRWVIPVLPKGELEVLLEASIALAKKGVDHLYEPCQRFYREGLTISFTKILTDEAVSGWKIEIHVSA